MIGGLTTGDSNMIGYYRNQLKMGIDISPEMGNVFANHQIIDYIGKINGKVFN